MDYVSHAITILRLACTWVYWTRTYDLQSSCPWRESDIASNNERGCCEAARRHGHVGRIFARRCVAYIDLRLRTLPTEPSECKRQ
jgi:hypothetical protein